VFRIYTSHIKTINILSYVILKTIDSTIELFLIKIFKTVHSVVNT